MLLRSSSTPILKTYAAACQLLTSSSNEVDHHGFSPTRPLTMALQRTSSESQLKLCSSVGNEKMVSKNCLGSPAIIKEKEEMNVCMKTASSLISDVALEDATGGGGGGGGGGGNNGGSWGSYHWPYNNGAEQMDAYYQGMIKTYPGDGLLLANYAKFLKEVRGDKMKAEEICERAILANARDGNVLSMYGDLIWNNYRDRTRAQIYFDEAVQSSPDDCYVVASYAKFLWDVDEEENEKKQFQCSTCSPTHNLSQGYSPLAFAS